LRVGRRLALIAIEQLVLDEQHGVVRRRIALLSRPLASAGVAGMTTVRPGTAANHTSRLCECWAA